MVVAIASSGLRVGLGEGAWAAATLLQGVCVGAMAWLLETTPVNAIKLPRRVSWVMILVGALAIQAPGGFWEVGLGLGVGAAAVGAALVVPARTRVSVWWVAPLAWSPALVDAGRALSDGADPLSGAIPLAALPGLVFAGRGWWGRRGAPVVFAATLIWHGVGVAALIAARLGEG